MSMCNPKTSRITIHNNTELTNHPCPHDSLPQRVGNATTRPRRAARLSGKLLRPLAVGRAHSHNAARATQAASQFEALVHDARKELNAALLAVLGRIHAQAAFLPLVPPRHVKGAAGGVNATQQTHFQTQKRVGTLFFPVRARLNVNARIAGTDAGAAVRAVVVALPQFVLGQVAAQHLAAHVPLRARDADTGEQTDAGPAAGRLEHGDFVAGTGARVRGGGKTKNQGKGERRAQDPKAIADRFDGRRDGFEDIGGGAETSVATAALLPTVGTDRVNGLVHKIGHLEEAAAAAAGTQAIHCILLLIIGGGGVENSSNFDTRRKGARMLGRLL